LFNLFTTVPAIFFYNNDITKKLKHKSMFVISQNQVIEEPMQGVSAELDTYKQGRIGW